MPNSVSNAIKSYLDLESTTGGYEAAVLKAAEIESVYGSLAALLHSSRRNIALTSSATKSFTQALSAFDFQPGDVIVTSRCDYTSNQIQYLALQKRLKIEVQHAADLPEGGVDPSSVESILRTNRCKLVAISWVPTNSGLVQDVHSIGRICKNAGVPFLIDACQAVGQVNVDVSELNCDYLTATARKFLRGPRGIGFMYVSDDALGRGDYPLYVDMRGARWTQQREFSVDPGAVRFEEWEAPYALVLGLGAAADYALQVGNEAYRRGPALAERLRKMLNEIPGVQTLDRGRAPCAIVTCSLNGHDAGKMVEALKKQRINTSATLEWYGIYDMREKGVSSALRASPHYYNTEDEIASLAVALRSLCSSPAA